MAKKEIHFVVEGRGGCCIARYAGVASKVGRIMLRFRPIAPKPTVNSPNTGVVVEASTPKRGGRRKTDSGSGSRGNRRGRKKRTPDEEEVGSVKREKVSDPIKDPIVTLRLMPETPDTGKVITSDPIVTLPLMPETPDTGKVITRDPIKDPIMPVPWQGRRTTLAAPTPLRPSASLVTVESVNNSRRWVDSSKLKDLEQLLEREKLPCFVSDLHGNFTSANEAYYKMVGGDEADGPRVAVVVKGKVPEGVDAFGCCVRVKYACLKERGSLTMPGDACRVDGGGFAWRLDVDTALSLRL